MGFWSAPQDYSLGWNVISSPFHPDRYPGPGTEHGPQAGDGGKAVGPAPKGTRVTARTGATPTNGTHVTARPGTAPAPGMGAGSDPRATQSLENAWKGTAVNPSPNSTRNGAPGAPPPNPYGSQSGPGILESWFNQRANGTDPAYEYALKRGGDDLDSRMSAGGSFNSGARGQQLSDFYANMGAQREGQLDALAGGASGEHQNRVNSMFGQGLGLAGGESGINSAYDLSAGNAMSDALKALLGYTQGKSGVDDKSRQSGFQNLMSLYALA